MMAPRLGQDLPAAGRLPEPDDLVSHRGQGRAIRREADETAVVGLPVAELAARGRVPDMDRCQGRAPPEVRGEDRPFRGRQFRAVAREREVAWLVVASSEPAEFPARGEVPEP